MHRASLLSCLPPLLLSGTASGRLGGVDVKVTNDSTDDIVVTVYDTSREPYGVALSHERVNGFTTVLVSLVADETGRANLLWTAVTADPTARKCGHENQAGLADSTSISVHADTDCSGA